MRKITLLCVGNLKEKYLIQAVAEYQKRLSRFFQFNIVEIAECKILGKGTQSEIDKSLDIEAEAILNKTKGKILIALCIEGQQLTSPQFADLITKQTDMGEIVFVIGSSFGLSDKVKSQANMQISISKMTFPHQLFRVLFCEQIYRAGTILNNIEYHK